MANKIFEVFKLTVEYEDRDIGGAGYIVRKEMFFQELEDAQHYMWNKYRNDRNNYQDYLEMYNKSSDVEVEKFDKNKMEYKYIGGAEILITAKIEMVEINHYGLRFKEDGMPDLTK